MESYFSPLTQRLFGIPPRRAASLAAGCFAVGGFIELFMINVWVKDTNCALCRRCRARPC